MILTIVFMLLTICGWEFGKWIYNRRGWKVIDRIAELDLVDYQILRSYRQLKIVSKKFGERTLFEIKGKKKLKGNIK